MKYHVRYDPKAEKQLEKLPRDIAGRIVKTMGKVGEDGRGIESLKEEQYGFKFALVITELFLISRTIQTLFGFE